MVQQNSLHTECPQDGVPRRPGGARLIKRTRRHRSKNPRGLALDYCGDSTQVAQQGSPPELDNFVGAGAKGLGHCQADILCSL